MGKINEVMEKKRFKFSINLAESNWWISDDIRVMLVDQTKLPGP